jgi:predicted transcriptional regulator of viral defense system
MRLVVTEPGSLAIYSCYISKVLANHYLEIVTNPMIALSHRDRAIAVARRKGVARAKGFDAAGIPRVYLRRLCDEGVLIRPARGFYQLADAELSAAHSLAEAAQAAPKGVIALLSALQFYGLTTQTPHEVWMLQPSKAWVPKNPPVALRIVRASGQALTSGVERHVIDGVSVPITVPAKTVADCFKYRSKVGLDVALEALRDALRKKRASADDIWRYTLIDRVGNVMRPYLEGAA